MSRVQAKPVKDDNADYIIYWPHPCTQLPPMSRGQLPNEGLQSTSIDIGIKNFAIRIEKRYNDGRVIPIYFHRIDFTKVGDNTGATTGNATVDPRIILTTLTFLDQIWEYLKDSRLIGIERQMSINVKATKMYQVVQTFFLCHISRFTYPDICIFDISPKLKGKILKSPKGITYDALKSWGIEKAYEILTARGDQTSITYLRNQSKNKSKTVNGIPKIADDLTDTIIQMEAFFILHQGIQTICGVDNEYNQNVVQEKISHPNILASDYIQQSKYLYR